MQEEGGQDTQENPALSLGFIFLADNHHTEAAVPSCLTENMFIYNNSERNVTQAYVRRVAGFINMFLALKIVWLTWFMLLLQCSVVQQTFGRQWSLVILKIYSLMNPESIYPKYTNHHHHTLPLVAEPRIIHILHSHIFRLAFYKGGIVNKSRHKACSDMVTGAEVIPESWHIRSPPQDDIKQARSCMWNLLHPSSTLTKTF